MIDEPDLPRDAWWRAARDRPRLSPLPTPAVTDAAHDPTGVPPAAPPPLDEWDLGQPEVGWAAVAPPAPEGVVDEGREPGPPVAASPASDAPARGRHDARPFLVRLLRPWFEPRPGELRGAVALLAVALAVSLALWVDASRRPSLPVDSGAPAAASEGEPRPQADGVPAGRADGSDGWGIGAPAVVGPVVHVSGAVRTPGLVTLVEAARVADALQAAGGAMPDARLDVLNLARIVDDGERIHVPRVGEDAPPPAEAPSRGAYPALRAATASRPRRRRSP